jgi:integrase/recombinase XerD
VTLEQLLRHFVSQAKPTPSVKMAIQLAWPKFLGYCEQQNRTEVAELQRHHIEDFHRHLLWQQHEQGRLYKANSVDQFVRRVRQVLRWAFSEGLVSPDPTFGLLLPRPVQTVVKTLSWSQLEDLLAVPDRSTAIGLRDALVFQLLAETNLGVSGLLNLTLESVTGLELESRTQELLAAYLRESRPALGGEGNALFFSRDGDPLANHVIQTRLKLAAQQIGLKGLPTRVLRKSYLAAIHGVQQRHPFQP